MTGITIKGLFKDVGIPIRVKFNQGSGPPAHIGGQEHGHDFTEVIVIHGGQGIHRVDGRDYSLVPGNVFVVCEMQTHAILDRTHLQYVEVTYDPRRVRLPIEHFHKLPGYHALFVLEPVRRRKAPFRGHLQLSPVPLAELMCVLKSMYKEYRERPPGYEATLLSHLIEFIVILSRAYSDETTGETKALLAAGKVISCLEQHFEKNWTLSELCEHANLSKSRLLALFKEATGRTPIEYLIHVRLRHAITLLKETDDPVTGIAYHVGFSDSNYFSRQFRKIVGCNPTEYRLKSK